MKKILILAVITLLLLGGYLYTSSNSTNRQNLDDRAIAYKQFQDVDKIWIRGRGVDGYFLKRKGDRWYYGDTVLISKYIMSNLQRAITQPTIKYIPTGNEAKGFLTSMNQQGIEVQLFDKRNNLLRDYWVGRNTNNETGTAYLVRGAKQPYVMELPFVEGTLRGFFINNVNEIRDKTLLALNPTDVKSIKVNYPKDTKNAFEIEEVKNEQFEVNRIYKSTQNEARPINEKAVENYLLSFRGINWETYESENPHREEITKRAPFCIYDINLKNGNAVNLKFWPLKDYLDLESNTKVLEDLKLVERFFVETGDGEFYIVQYRNLKGLMVSHQFFY